MARPLYTIMCAAVLCLWVFPAAAQQTIKVRAGVHSGYNRLVLDWPDAPAYQVVQNGTRLTVTFDTTAAVDLGDGGLSELTTIKNVASVSKPGEALVLGMDIPQGSRFRHFSAGDRIVLDVYDVPGQTAAPPEKKEAVKEEPKPAAEKKAEAPKPAPKPEAKAAAVPETKPAAAEKPKETPKESPKESPEAAPEAAAAKEQDAPVEAVEAKHLPPPSLEPHVVTVTATKNIGMAVFQRADTLWIVVDDPELTIPPQISGPQKDRIPEARRVDVQGGTAYYLNLPQGLHVQGEGGGLLWRVILSPQKKDISTKEPARSFAEGQRVRGGTLSWALGGVRKIITVPDPVYGDTVTVATVAEALHHVGDPREFVELKTLPSIVGMALVPKVDDLAVRAEEPGVVATRPGAGLAMSRERDIRPVTLRKEIDRKKEPAPLPAYAQEEEKPPEKKEELSRIYYFDRWEMGGVRALDENQNVLMAAITPKDKNGKVEDLMTLAKLTLANERSYESLGYLKVAGDEMPEIADGLEYRALRGAANALAGKFDQAIEDIADPLLDGYGELKYWRAFTLAGLEDWQQAAQVMPDNFDVLAGYPLQLREPLGLVMTEIALRAGKVPVAEGLLGMLEGNKANMSKARQAAWDYLMGEAQRQLNNKAKAREYWEPLLKSNDDLYRVKAGLSLTKLQLEAADITPAQAIDRLEGLRYLWRGDELETLINYRLGLVYIDNKDYLKGLSVLRNAVSLSPQSKMAQDVAAYMTKTFRDLFMVEGLEGVPPLDAVTIYDEFKELTPAGDDGNKFVELLAERLVGVDLLGRAATLLDHQVTHRLQGPEKARVAVRLAAIRLLDNKPEGAMRALGVAEEAMKEPGPDGKAAPANPGREREIKLLRARAYSKLKQPDKALEILDSMEKDTIVSRLRADVSWNAGNWEVAADAFQDLLAAEDTSPHRPLTAYQTDLILNRGIALNLSGNRAALANLRERFADGMKQSEKAQLFDVVSRPRQLGLIGSRENVTSLISEVDMFKDFLDTYKGEKKKEEGAAAPAPAESAKPAAEAEKKP